MTRPERSNETQAMQSIKTCGQVFVFLAHGGRLFRGGSDFVALKMANVVATIDSKTKLQAEWTPRRNNLAARALDLMC
jgi:hypothetical protein